MEELDDDPVVIEAYDARACYFDPPPGDGGAAFLAVARTRHPTLFKKLSGGLSALEDGLVMFAGRGEIEIVRTLLDLGVDPDATTAILPVNALAQAVSSGKLELVRLLVERGASVNIEHEGRRCCFPLFRAVMANRRDIAEYLVSQGALVNFLNGAGATPLNAAKSDEMRTWLRSVGAKLGKEFAPDFVPNVPPRPTTLREYLRPLGNVREFPLREIIPGDPPLTLLQVTMEERIAIVTDGLAAQRQDVPPTEGITRFELCCFLPFDWPLDEAAMQNPDHRWPIDWLRQLARFPDAKDTYLRRVTIFANGDPPAALASNTKLSCVMVSKGFEDWMEWTRPDGEPVSVLMLTPLYAAERDVERTEGLPGLVEALGNHVSTTIDPTRPCVV